MIRDVAGSVPDCCKKVRITIKRVLIFLLGEGSYLQFVKDTASVKHDKAKCKKRGVPVTPPTCLCPLNTGLVDVSEGGGSGDRNLDLTPISSTRWLNHFVCFTAPAWTSVL